MTAGVHIAPTSQGIMESQEDIMVGELQKEVGLALLLFVAVAFDAPHQLTGRQNKSRRKGRSLISPRQG